MTLTFNLIYRYTCPYIHDFPTSKTATGVYLRVKSFLGHLEKLEALARRNRYPKSWGHETHDPKTKAKRYNRKVGGTNDTDESMHIVQCMINLSHEAGFLFEL